MNKLSEIIGKLSFHELNLIKKDLDEGNIHRLINRKLEKKPKFEVSSCPVCGAEVSKTEGFVLEFGKEIRKRAVFDELDCLHYFIQRMK